jgi:hypothetical protein
MQNLYTVWGQVAKWEPSELIGIYDSKDKALEVLTLAENALLADGYPRFYNVWIDTNNLNETMDLT